MIDYVKHHIFYWTKLEACNCSIDKKWNLKHFFLCIVSAPHESNRLMPLRYVYENHFMHVQFSLFLVRS